MKKSDDPIVTRIVAATVAAGVAAVVGQLLIIREFLAQFQGNEFVIALIFFNWLALGGAGTLLARWVCRRRHPSPAMPGWLALLLATLSTALVLAIRTLRDMVFVAGASVGFYPTLAFTFGVMAPYGLLVGFLLLFNLYAIRARQRHYPGVCIYMADGLGSVVGGILFSFILVRWTPPLWAMALAHLPLVAAAGLLFTAAGWRPTTAWLTAVTVAAVLLACPALEYASLTPPTGKLIAWSETPYGRISIHQDQEQVTLFGDGVPLSASQDRALAEEGVHYPLSQVDRPRRVLLISARAGMMAEVAKYGSPAVDYVELNPAVSALQFKYNLLHRFPGLQVIHRDARSFLKSTPLRYDVIIATLPEPQTFQINRFYTRRFFELVRQRLNDRGVFSFSMAGFDNYPSETQRHKLSTVYTTAAAVFAHVTLLPGRQIFFLCSAHSIDTDITGRLAARRIATGYISGYFAGDVTARRISDLEALMDRSAALNEDRAPRLMQLVFSQWFEKFMTSPQMFFAVLAVFFGAYLVLIKREAVVLFTTGWLIMGAEILVIFAFQIYFGYIYLRIGMIVTAFLAGLLPGAWLGRRTTAMGDRALLALSDGLLITGVALFAVGIIAGGDHLPEAFYLAFGFTLALVGGFQFSVALRRGSDDDSAAAIFSADLMGAACGTLVTSTLLIPYFGIAGAALGLILLKFVSLAVMGWQHG